MTGRRAFLSTALAAGAGALLGCKRGDAAGAGAAPSASALAGVHLRIGIVPKGTAHEFWRRVHAGAVKASRETGAEILWQGPQKDDDVASQIDVLQSFVGQKVHGILLAPVSDTELKGAVLSAMAAKIKVGVFDSELPGVDVTSFIATDNFEAGRLAGDALAGALHFKGKVALLRCREGSTSTAHRERGFIDAVARHPGMLVVSSSHYGGPTTETAAVESETLLSASKAAAGGVDGIFTPNESTTTGMLQALTKAGLTRKVRLVGFDASEKLVQGLRNAQIAALVIQDPFKIGYLAVKTMVAALHGESVDPRVDTGVRVVKRDDLGDPAVKALLAPDLTEWLGK